MATPITNIGLGDIQTEFGGSPEISLTEYYRKDAYVPEGQEKSEHHPVRIPLVPQFIESGDGPGSFTGFSEISIGMFRGLSKKFKHTFNITADRFTTFNLKTELTAVGWSDTSIPVDVIINISAGVHVVSNSVNTPAIDASDVFPSMSMLTINNAGYIFGRGGNGGQGGIYPNTAGTPGQDGGTAIYVTLRTKISNHRTISGGGGGGGGSSGYSSMDWVQSNSSGDGPSYHAAPICIHGIPGGGGAPFGAAGPAQPVRSSPIPFDYGTFTAQPGTYAASAAGLTNPGNPGYVRIGPAVSYNRVEAGQGAIPGSEGHHGTNIEPTGPIYLGDGLGWVDSNNVNSSTLPSDGLGVPMNAFYMTQYGFTSGGAGGQPGHAIIGGQHIVWEVLGDVKGRIDNFGFLRTTNLNQSNYFNGATRSVSAITRLRPPTPIPFFWSWYPTPNPITEFGHDWTREVSSFYSYSTITEGVNQNPPYTKSYSPGSKTILYSCILDLKDSTMLKLHGWVDTSIPITVYLNGTFQVVGGLSRISSKTTIGYADFFSVPAGIHVLTVAVLDYMTDFGGHMFNLSVSSGIYYQLLVKPDQWYVNSVF